MRGQATPSKQRQPTNHQTSTATARFLQQHHSLASELVPSRSLGDPKTCVVLHGLLGSAKNLRTPAKKIAERHLGYQVLLVDVRGHGGSTALNAHAVAADGPTSTLADAAHDLMATLEGMGVRPDMVCGHSMGGKVAMAYLDACVGGVYGDAYPPPRRTWVWDSAPGLVDRAAATGETQSVASVLEAVSQVDVPVATKADLVAQLEGLGIAKPIAQWFTTNLVPSKTTKGSFELSFDLPTANALFASYGDTDYLPLVATVSRGEAPVAVGGEAPRLDIVRAGKNRSLWNEAAMAGLTAAMAEGEGQEGGVALAQSHELAKAGHWLHVDDLPGLLEVMDSSFAR